MPTSNHNTSHKGTNIIVGNGTNNNNTSGGFSLTTSLKGGARSINSSNNSTGVDSTTRLREGINNSSPAAISGAKNLRRSAPPPNTNSNTQTSSSIGAPHPIQTTKSFNSATNYKQIQQSSQNTNQQQHRRAANYRNQPNKSKVSPRNTSQQQGQHRRSESAGGRLWNNFTSGKSAFVMFFV